MSVNDLILITAIRNELGRLQNPIFKGVLIRTLTAAAAAGKVLSYNRLFNFKKKKHNVAFTSIHCNFSAHSQHLSHTEQIIIKLMEGYCWQQTAACKPRQVTNLTS